MPKQPKLEQVQKGMIAGLLCLALAIGVFDGQSLQQSSPAANNASAPERTDKQNDGHQNISKGMASDDWLALFTLGLVVVGGIQVRLFWVQLRLIRESLNDAKLAADAAKEAADAAKTQTEIAQREFISSHRPKIRIKHVWLVALGSNQPVTVEIIYVNVGDAKAVISKIGMDFNVINPDAQLPPGMTAPERLYIKYPEIGLGVSINTGNVVSAKPIDEERITAIRNGTKLLCCFGFMEYSDIGPEETRKIRRTAFCRVYKPSLRAIDGMGRFIRPEKPDPDYEYED
jgi:hypothetical protein